MNWLDNFKYKHRRFGIENLMLYILIPMVVIFIFQYIGNVPLIAYLSFDRDLILQGQVWRIVTFLFLPETYNILFFIISIYFYFFIGRALENAWGKQLFTLFYLIGALMAIISGFIFGSTTSSYLNGTLFFAFAFLYPNAKLLIFGIIPIKAIYLALVEGFFYVLGFITALIERQWGEVLALILAIVNLAIFFGPSFYDDMKRKSRVAKRRKDYEESFRK